MAEFHFLRPLWLWGLVPVVLVWWGLWRVQDQTSAWRRMIDPHLLDHLLVGERKRRRLRPVHLAFILGAVCILALAGPAWEREPSPFADDQAGLVVLLKANSTMNATDVQPSRLERSKHKLQDLLERREGATTGLIVYSGSAHLVMPLTRDSRILTAMANELSPELMPRDGDALGEALQLAERVLERAGAPGSVLVVADAVSPNQVSAVEEAAPGLPVQFLSVRPPNVPADDGLKQVARMRHAAVVPMTIDQADVDEIAARAQTDFRAAPTAAGDERWRDAGYAVLPLIALVGLAWSRRGWVVS
ncbi:MAG: VWA domain-containing protein [Candidatus Krumholzibacteriota bacterium]